MLKRAVTIWSVGVMSVLFAVGCGDDNPSFSLLPEEETFTGFSGGQVTAKMDILWVIDNSGSMETSQENVRDNFDSFIQDFSDKGYDYKISVVSTDAYKSRYSWNQSWSEFRDGPREDSSSENHSGVYVITPQTADVIGTFMINVMQGVDGSGDERGLESMMAAFDNPSNADFLRDDSFLSVVFVSDEEDRSRDAPEYGSAALHNLDSYLEYLDNFTNSSEESRRYNINSVVIQDPVCEQQLEDSFTGRDIGQRYIDLTTATEGVSGSLCGDFANILQDIATQIIQEAVQVYLNREPIVDTIEVYINGAPVPPADTSLPQSQWDGYVYHEDSNSITFHGSYVPNQGDTVTVDYDPVQYGS